MAHKSLQSTDFRRRWNPGFRALTLAEPSNERSVAGVGFGTKQLALGERFDPSRIDHAYAILETVEVQCYGFPIRASRFHADVDVDRVCS